MLLDLALVLTFCLLAIPSSLFVLGYSLHSSYLCVALMGDLGLMADAIQVLWEHFDLDVMEQHAPKVARKDKY